MSEEAEKVRHLVQEAALVRDMMQHQGMAILRKRIEKVAMRDHSRWLLAENDEQAAKVRAEAKGYEQFFSLVKQVLLEGENAARFIAAEIPPPQG